MKKNKKNAAWAEAKKKCRLNQAEIQMAKELGMTPKSLLKNIPSPTQKWKAPVKYWVRDLYEKKFGKVIKSDKSKPSNKLETKHEDKSERRNLNSNDIFDEDLPF
ncbi:hypothetical protein ACM26V_20625 [Salipaludibacillus sp. HK11]|uniref:hypothetical protein n=1 Tax=Salipaludibacillus sp. HK11 TaxID=3394320 RepID=UPI0039FC241C